MFLVSLDLNIYLFAGQCLLLTTIANSLDPDQARHFVGPDLGPNCLQRLV